MIGKCFNWVFRRVQSAARRRGCLITKYPVSDPGPFPAFDVAVSALRFSSGDALTFIQVGANDAGPGDPIARYATTLPWTGVVVEPQSDVFEHLAMRYHNVPGDIRLENVAVSPAGQDGLVLYRLSAALRYQPTYDHARDSKLVSSNPHTAARSLGVAIDELESFRVPSLSLDQIVQKHNIGKVDLLLIDTEGFDDIVLYSLSLDRTLPTLIQFEHGHLSPASVERVVSHLRRHGYFVLYGTVQCDTLAIHESWFP